MKIGIVTYYKAINNGAFLQAYCLKKFVEEVYSGEVFFVPFSTDTVSKDILKNKKNPLKLLNALLRYKSISMFQKRELVEGDRTEHYDLIIAGSDEIWNIRNKVFTFENMAVNLNADAYITYAISMGNTALEERFPTDFARELDKFNYVSVRDFNSEKILREKFSIDACINVDPVFLADIPKYEKHKIRKKYLMVYGGIDKKDIYTAILSYAKEQDLDVISVDSYNKWCKTIVSRNPFDFVDYIRNAECVVTNMFHGTMLSVVLKKKFVSILTKTRSPKMSHAITIFSIQDNVIEEEELQKDCKRMKDIINSPVNSKHIDCMIEVEREKAQKYLMSIFR